VLRTVKKEVAYMSGSCALPRSSGELIFDDDWERRIFALGVALCEEGGVDWDDFKRKLIKAIELSEKPDSEDLNYYECWLNALESLLFERNQDLLNRDNST
tara:strand:+ start:337 stop:639 length:303 start_codon:yes stop_codon:yes gene_type:complete